MKAAFSSPKGSISRWYRTLVALMPVVVELAGHLSAAAPQPAGSVLVILANGLSFDDLAGDKRFGKFRRNASVALISQTVSERRSLSAVAASFAAGANSAGSDEFALALEVSEKIDDQSAASVYARRTGNKAPDTGIVCLGLPAAIRNDAANHAGVVPYALGQSLKQSGVARAAFGNSDTPAQRSRLAAAVLADSSGRVFRGSIGNESQLPDIQMPGGKRLAIEKLTPEILLNLRERAVVTVDYGDIAKIESERSSSTPSAYRIVREEAIQRLLQWLLFLQEQVPDNTPILLVSLAPPPLADGRYNQLGVMAASGAGFSGGLLESRTTRTPGLIAVMDIAPTILRLAQARPIAGMVGGIAVPVSNDDPYAVIRQWSETIKLNRQMQYPVLFGLGLAAGAAGILAAWTIAATLRSPLMTRLSVVALAIAAWIPVVLLVPLDQPEWYFALAPALALGFALGSQYKKGFRFLPIEAAGLALLAGTAASCIGLVDWVKRSVLSGYQFDGFRFYGIGNEFMGCIVGAAAVIPLWRYGRESKNVPMTGLSIWFLIWALMLGLPSLGADFGGAIASTTTFVLILTALSDKKIRFRDACIACACGIALGIGVSVLDKFLSDNPSHLGTAIQGVSRGDFTLIASIIQRKAMMNLSQWVRIETAVVFAIFASVLLVWNTVRDRMSALLKLPSRMQEGLKAVAYGGAAAIAFNDSGLVSFAFILSYVMLWLIWDAVTLKAGVPRMAVARARSRG